MSTPSSVGGGPSRLKETNESTRLKRHSAFQEIEDEEEDEHYQQQHKSNRNGSSAGKWKEESLSGYSARDDERRRNEKQQQQLVIQKQADANWMEERKKRLGLEKYRKELGSLSGGFGGGKTNNGVANERVGDEEQRIGLEVRHRLENTDEEDKMQTDNEHDVPTERQPFKAEDQDEDTQARKALLSIGGNKNAQHENDIIINPITEEEALQRDMDSRPDPPSLSDYANMPVDDFGAALLRGMGWKEGMGAGKQRQGPINAPEIKKRAALLGLGAKERETPIQSGSSNRTSSSSQYKPERRYVPVTRKERDEGRGQKEESRSRSNKDRKRSYSPPTSSRSSRYEEDRQRSKRDRDRYSDSRRNDRDYDRRRESERRDDRSRRDDRRDRHRSER